MKRKTIKRIGFIIIIILIGLLTAGCLYTQNKNSTFQGKEPQQEGSHEVSLKRSSGTNIKERFVPPQGFERIKAETDSFANYLQTLPLKPNGARVYYYDGREKNKDVHEAVINIDVGERDLQQCADAIIRLRAEYLYSEGKNEDIAFHFTNGFLADYKEWMKGKRITVQGNDVSWINGGEPSNSYESFREYLDMVFAYAGTLSLSQELTPRSLEYMEIGDVFIQGGSPGHAVIIVDMAINSVNKEKVFMIAQSYMPAQDMHILKNPEDKSISPWYSTEDVGAMIHTPEWTFQPNDLKHFEE